MKTSLFLTAIFYFLLSPLAFPQGILTPSGVPAPTMKTLDQVEARTPLDAAHTPGDASNEFNITQPGSYYLTGNLSVAKTNGIHITAAGVTVDLNGFQIARTAGGGSGIVADAGANRCTIRNGSITGFSQYGLVAFLTRGGVLSHVVAAGCGFGGLSAGDGWEVDHCTAHDNTGSGIRAEGGSTVSHCSARNNGGDGIRIGPGSTISHSSATGNQGVASIATNGNGCTIAHWTATGNTSASSQSAGINTTNGCTVTECTVEGNTSTNATPSGSTGAGIITGSHSKAQNCTASSNKGDGIKTTSECTLIANNSARNGNGGDGAGVRVTGSGSRIEGNNVTFNTDFGIRVDGAGNLIIKNSASRNKGKSRPRLRT